MKPVLALLIRALRQLKNSSSSLVCRLLVGLILLFCLWGTQEAAGWSGAPGKAYFTSLVTINYLLVTVGAVVIGADAIAGEKQEGSLGLLRLADLSPVSLLLGKCVGQLTGLLLLLAFQIPFTLLAVTLGGVAVRQVFESYALLGSYLIALTSLGLFSSVVLAKVWRAVVMTVSASICLALLPVWLQSASERLNPAGLLWDREKQMVVNSSSVRITESSVDPPTIKVADQLQRAADWIRSVSPLSHWTRFAGLGSQVDRSSLAACWYTGPSLHSALRSRGSSLSGTAAMKLDMAKAVKDQPIRLRFSLFRLPRTVSTPVVWKDFHFHFGGKPWFILRLVAYPLIAAIVITQGYLPVNIQTIVMNLWAVGLVILYFDVAFFVIRSWGPKCGIAILANSSLPRVVSLALTYRSAWPPLSH
jgi:ABC-type transport system involved in multi-copper enzyme maturation permease subunit